MVNEMINVTVEHAMNIIRRHQSDTPVDVVSIAHDLGIKIYSADANDDISGKNRKRPIRGGNSGYAIFINAKHVPVRQRFTIAHEIAHYILHREEIGDGLIDDALYRSGLSNKKEADANKLAAEILMHGTL